MVTTRKPRPTVAGITFASHLEANLYRAWLRRFPFITLHPQVRIVAAKGHPRVDFCHLATKTIAEADGLAWHNSPLARQADAARDAALREVGYEVVRFDGREITANVNGCVEKLYRMILERQG